MARSSYVYLVTGYKGDALATFTVKRELNTWLRLRCSVAPGVGTYWRVYRLRDGSPRDFSDYTGQSVNDWLLEQK